MWRLLKCNIRLWFKWHRSDYLCSNEWLRYLLGPCGSFCSELMKEKRDQKNYMQQSAAMCSTSQRESSTVLHQPMPAAPAEYSLHSISGAKWARLNCLHTEAIRRMWTCRHSHMQLRWSPLTTCLDYQCPFCAVLTHPDLCSCTLIKNSRYSCRESDALTQAETTTVN